MGKKLIVLIMSIAMIALCGCGAAQRGSDAGDKETASKIAYRYASRSVTQAATPTGPGSTCRSRLWRNV